MANQQTLAQCLMWQNIVQRLPPFLTPWAGPDINRSNIYLFSVEGCLFPRYTLIEPTYSSAWSAAMSALHWPAFLLGLTSLILPARGFISLPGLILMVIGTVLPENRS